MATAGEMHADPRRLTLLEVMIEEWAESPPGSQARAVSKHRRCAHPRFDAVTTARDSFDSGFGTGSRDREIADFAAFVEEFEPRIAALLSRMLDDPRDVEEATQDTFVQAWRNLDTFRGDAQVFTWLYRIATNTALMRLRRRRHRTVPLDELRDTAPLNGADGAGEWVSRLDLVDSVRSALASLPAEQRVVVVLRDVEGFSNDEVAAILGVAVPAVKTRLHRGRTRLRARLHPSGVTGTNPERPITTRG